MIIPKNEAVFQSRTAAAESHDKVYRMREKHRTILWLAAMLLAVFFAANWIYGRTQLSGWIPLPFSIVLLVGATFQSFDLIGQLLGPSNTLARRLGIGSVAISLVVSMSALVIFSLTQGPETSLATAEGIQVPDEEAAATTDLVIEVRENAYEFRADGSTTTDLDSLIARCQELILNNPDSRVTISAASDVPYQRVVEVMSALTAIGVSDIRISAHAN